MNSGGPGNMRGGMQMIYNTIEFRSDPFSYFLSFGKGRQCHRKDVSLPDVRGFENDEGVSETKTF